MNTSLAGHVAVESTAEDFLAIAAEPALAHHRQIVVTGAASAVEALRVALRGELVLIHASAERGTLDRLYEDLRRLGGIAVRSGPRPPSGLDRLSGDEAALLRLLASGRTLRGAAGELHIGPRTADRRLASARAKLGVATTIEAVAEFTR